MQIRLESCSRSGELICDAQLIRTREQRAPNVLSPQDRPRERAAKFFDRTLIQLAGDADDMISRRACNTGAGWQLEKIFE
jgi:hypothetical protein